MAERYPEDRVRVVEFTADEPEDPTRAFTHAATWLEQRGGVGIVGVCLCYSDSGYYTLQLCVSEV